MSIKLSANTNILSGNRLKINNDIIQYDKIICISPDGNDTSGDGSASKPYKSFYTAQQNAIDNTCILFGIGTFDLGTGSRVDSWKNGSAIEYVLAHFYQKTGKIIDIVGQGYETLVICSAERPPNTSTERYRDMHLIYSIGIKSLSRMSIKYRGTDLFDSAGHSGAGYTGRYQNAIFCFSSCIIRNCYIEVMGNWFAMQYYNGNGSNGGSILNSVIKSNGLIYTDFNSGRPGQFNSGLVSIKDTLIDTNYSGSQTIKENVIERSIIDEDISYGDTTIGVCSGPYAWERKDKPKFLSKIIPQSDGSYKDLSGYVTSIDSGPTVAGNYPVLTPQDSTDYPIKNYDVYASSEYGSPRSLSVSYTGFNILRCTGFNDESIYNVSEFTMRFWVKINNISLKNPVIFYAYSSSTDPKQGRYDICLSPTSFYASLDVETMSDYSNGKLVPIYTVLNTINNNNWTANTWHNFIFSRNTNNVYQLFVDGLLVGSNHTTNKFEICSDISKYYSIGSMVMYGKSVHKNFSFDGKIFDFSIIDKGIPTLTNKYKILTPYSYWDGRIVITNDNNEELIIY